MSGLVPSTTRALLTGHLDALSNAVAQCRLHLDNVDAASDDDEGWVVLDNLRGMPRAVARVHAEASRLFVAAEDAEEQAADVLLGRTR